MNITLYMDFPEGANPANDVLTATTNPKVPMPKGLRRVVIDFTLLPNAMKRLLRADNIHVSDVDPDGGVEVGEVVEGPQKRKGSPRRAVRGAKATEVPPEVLKALPREKGGRHIHYDKDGGVRVEEPT